MTESRTPAPLDERALFEAAYLEIVGITFADAQRRGVYDLDFMFKLWQARAALRTVAAPADASMLRTELAALLQQFAVLDTREAGDFHHRQRCYRKEYVDPLIARLAALSTQQGADHG